MEVKLSDNELSAIFNAVSEITTKGTTDIKCPRCKTHLTVELFNNSQIVYCETTDCVKLTCRGI